LKPSVFIGSSSEVSSLVDILIQELSRVADVKPWNRAGLFTSGVYALPELIKEVKSVDFAVFVFSPDDKVTSRGELFQAARDNVLIEFGLFTSSLGLERTFVVIAKSTKVPSDLAGLTMIFYDDAKYKTDPSAALQNEVAKLRTQITKKGLNPEREIATDVAELIGWSSPTEAWKPNGNVLELAEDTAQSVASYTWSPQMLRIGGVIEFKMSLEKCSSGTHIFDFRVGLFSSSSVATRSSSSHYLLLAPWSGDTPVQGGDDIRMDYMAAGQAHTKLQVTLDPKFRLGQPYKYRLTLKTDHIVLEIDNTYKIIYPVDVSNELREGRHFWGFSSYMAHLSITDLRTNLG